MKSFLFLCAAFLPLNVLAETADSTIAQHHTLSEVVVKGFKQDNLNNAPMSVSVAGSNFLSPNKGYTWYASPFETLWIVIVPVANYSGHLTPSTNEGTPLSPQLK